MVRGRRGLPGGLFGAFAYDLYKNIGSLDASAGLVLALTLFLGRMLKDDEYSAKLVGVAPMNRILGKRHFHDIGKLMVAFVMLFAYFSFSQWLIIWAGNLPEEITWYMRRLNGGWGWIGAALILLHFALPFLLLLPEAANRNTRILATVAGLVVLMRFVDVYWLVRPVFTQASASAASAR